METEEETVQTKPIADQITSLIQRQPEEEEEEEEREEEEEPIMPKLADGSLLQRQEEEPEEEEEEGEPIQPKLARGETAHVGPDLRTRINSLKGGGQPLPRSVRSFFEPRFGYDFGGVRVHVDARAAEAAGTVNARAFTVGKNIIFGSGQYSPETTAGRKLLGHELTHTVQQSSGLPANETVPEQVAAEAPEKQARAAITAKNGRAPGNPSGRLVDGPAVQRVVEVRPPGRGEASAFPRRGELIDKLNNLSPAMQFGLTGNVLTYTVVDAAALTGFHNQMRGFIDRAQVVPMRLITRQGYVGGRPLDVDSLQLGYVDLEDMLASDDLSFQMNLIHLLAERFAVRNYERRLGMASVGAEWARAHPIGLEAEAELLRSQFSDPSIRYVYTEVRPNGTVVFGFRSQAERYWVFHVFRRAGRELRGGNVFIRTAGGNRMTVAQFLAVRAAAAAAAAVRLAPAPAGP